MKYTHTVFTALKDLSDDSPLELNVNGQCMAPGIESGSRIEVRTARLYFPGDIIVVHDHARQLVAHRLLLVYRRHGRWKALTRADNAQRPDAAVPVQRILGKVHTGKAVPILVRAKSLYLGVVVLCRRVKKNAHMKIFPVLLLNAFLLSFIPPAFASNHCEPGTIDCDDAASEQVRQTQQNALDMLRESLETEKKKQRLLEEQNKMPKPAEFNQGTQELPESLKE